MAVRRETFPAIALRDDHAHETLLFECIPQILGHVAIDGNLIIINALADILHFLVHEGWMEVIFDRRSGKLVNDRINNGGHDRTLLQDLWNRSQGIAMPNC